MPLRRHNIPFNVFRCVRNYLFLFNVFDAIGGRKFSRRIRYDNSVTTRRSLVERPVLQMHIFVSKTRYGTELDTPDLPGTEFHVRRACKAICTVDDFDSEPKKANISEF